MPAPEDRHWLQSIVARLAHQYDAPVFAPHVTIFSGEYVLETPVSETMRNVVRDIHPFTLVANGVAHSDEFIKTLYLVLSDTLMLTKLSKRVEEQACSPAQDVLKPHLSLLYKRMSSSARARCAAAVSTDRTEIRFDAVQAVETPKRTTDRRDIESWKPLGGVSLPV